MKLVDLNKIQIHVNVLVLISLSSAPIWCFYLLSEQPQKLNC